MLTKWITSFSLFLYFSSLIPLHAALPNETPPSPPEVIVFDFSGVIAKTDKEELAEFIAGSLELSQEEALQALAQFKIYASKGGTQSDFWIAYAKSHDKSLPPGWFEQLYEAQLKAVKEIPGMTDLVKNLQKQGFQTALLSNVKEHHAKVKRQLGYYDLFYPVLLSYEVGANKPDPKIFEILLERLNKRADQILFIDNKLINVEGAQAMGIDSIFFTSKDQLIDALKERGVDATLSSPVILNK
jgi:putative hydrolase of the HAD superfamily